MYPMRRTWMGGLLASVATLWAHSSASAPPPPSPKPSGPTGVCAKSVQEARQLIDAGHLRRARDAYARCAQATCGGLISQQCRSKLQQLETDVPSVIAVATDAAGAQRVDVRVSVDGELLASQIDGRSLEVDPGLHEFSFSTQQGDVSTEKVLILQGQRNRVIPVQLKQKAAAPLAAETTAPLHVSEPAPNVTEQASAAKSLRADEARSTTTRAVSTDGAPSAPVLAYVVGGVGVAAVGSAFLLAHWGREDNLLLDRCAPNCSQDSVDHVSNMYLAADITLGAGVVALGAATWLFLSRPGVEDTKAAQGYRVDVRPMKSGAFATVGSSF
jgi:hypothetical protein